MNKITSALIPSLFFVGFAEANPVEVPYSTDFSTDFGDFFVPSGNGYNAGHEWRAENYQSWVTDTNRTVTASMQARALAGEEFFIKVTIDPVEIVGGGQSFGFGACGNTNVFGSYYLADVKPAENTFRILQISGGTTTIAAETTINGLSLTDLDPFDLELTGVRSGNSITLALTVRKDGASDTLTGTDTTSLDGPFFGLRLRNQGTRYECHFDDYELRALHNISVTSSPSQFAPIGEFYQYQVSADAAASYIVVGDLPAWLNLTSSGLLSGTPIASDAGTDTIEVLATSSDGATALQKFTISVPSIPSVVISEFMADNDKTLTDEEGDSSDWIEILNPSSAPVNLDGWHLTDDSTLLSKWTFPNGTTVPAFGHLIVFASGKDLAGHANFRLDDAEGSYLALARPDLSIASRFDNYPEQREDVSYGVFGDYTHEGFFLEATPAFPNGVTGYGGFTGDTNFSVSRGVYRTPFTVQVSSGTPGATIVTTTDGSVPTLTNGAQATSSASISITKTTVLRAAAFVDGLAPTNVDSQSYLFLDDIRTQDRAEALADGWPSGSINGQVFDYGMDPDIINSISVAEYEEAMTDIPSLSLVTDLDNLNDPETGFWVNSENRGRAWERPVSMELINPDGSEGFQIDAGFRLRGGYSRQGSNAKHSFRLVFRSEYGDGKLDYPLFGEEGTDRFEALDLRSTQGKSWHFSHSTDATFNRDVFARETQRDMEQPYSRSRYYHLYLNGQYFGLFQSQERMNADFAASYFGGDNDDYDVMKTRTRPHRVEALDGDADAWGRLYDAAVAGLSSDASYYAVQGLSPSGEPDPSGENLLDVDNLIDYMITIFYTGQSDGPVNANANVPKNFFAFRPRDGRFGYRFLVHDNEDSLNSNTANVSGNNSTGDRLIYFNPKWLHQQLSSNALYRQRFGDRAHLHCFNGGALTTSEGQARFSATADAIENAIIGESARWGDARRANPYDQADWENAINGKLTGLIPARNGAVISQLRSRDLYPDVTAPSFSQHGGAISSGFGLGIDAPSGVIFYTLDGSDPSEAGGLIFNPNSSSDSLLPANSAGWNYLVTDVPFSDSEVSVGHPSYGSGDWKHPSFDVSAWETGTAPLGYGGVGSPSWTTEIGSGTGATRNRTTYLRKVFQVNGAENYSDLTFNIRRDDGAIVYLNGREVARSNMPAGNISYTDIASGNASGSNETSYFPVTYTLGAGELQEGPNTLAVEIHQGSTSSSDLVIDVAVLGTNSNGSGIVLTENTTVQTRTLENGEWSALNAVEFFTSVPATSETLVISEIFFNPPDSDESTEYLELLNISATESIHLDGLSFTDGITFDFPDGIVLSPGERVILAKDIAAFEAEFGTGLNVLGPFGGSLGNGGEQLVLTEVIDFVYDDKFPWPASADGDGRSLVYLSGDPALPENWRASAIEGGSPGGTDTTIFTGDDLAAYAFGGYQARMESNLEYTFVRNLAATGITYTLQTSNDLENWSDASNWSKTSEWIVEGSIIAETWSSDTSADKKFLRISASQN